MLQVDVVSRRTLAAERQAEIVALCTRAYEEPFDEYLAPFTDGLHLLGLLDGRLVSHLLVVPRPLHHAGLVLHTAYIEAVATEPSLQGRGFASTLLRRAADEIRDYDLGVLSPSDAAFYERLGWQRWRGPLALRTAEGDELMPEEEVMYLRLPRTPPIDPDGLLACEWRPGEIW